MTQPSAEDLMRRAADVDTQIAAFGELAPIAAAVTTAFPDAAAITRATGFLTDLDIARVLTDLDAVVGAHQSFLAAADLVAARSVATSWQGRSGDAAVAAVDAHTRSGGVELATLIDLAATATPALTGLKVLLQNVFDALDAVTDPLLAGHPVSTVPAALSAGTLRTGAVADEIGARVRLFDTATGIGRTGIRDILAELVGVDAAASTGELALAGEQ